ncbi:MAG: IS21 family transposase [Deltaproteobacteria bacterium]|nr:IS21 family transposase [Deltaproteobacteria bacterium]
MKTTPEIEAEIVRLHYAEHWPVGTIATQLEAHPDVVRRVLGFGEARAPSQLRPRIVDPYRAFIDDTLHRYPKLLATRLYDMIRERGYGGSVRTLRDYVALVRPRPKREAYLVTETLPGEQAQVDWAYVGKVAVPGGERALWVFVIVLAHSRAMWGEFVIDLTVHSLCRSLVRGAAAFGGVSRQWLFDNPKVVVLERVGTAVRFHPTLLALSAAMRVEPKLCAVRKPRHKGKVERAIRYLRDRFLAGRSITGVDDGNRALAKFIEEIAHVRPHPTIAQRSVGDVFADERARLLSLPDPLPETARVEPVQVDSQALVRVDTNRYSVPSDHAQHVRTLVVDDRTVRVVDGTTVLAEHARSWGRRQLFEKPEHRAALVAKRPAARDLKGRDRLRAVAPTFDRIVARWAVSGSSLGLRVTRSIKLLDLYGDDVFAAAAADLDARGLADVGTLAIACEQRRKDRRRPVPVELVLPAHLDDADVIPHDLAAYDE